MKKYLSLITILLLFLCYSVKENVFAATAKSFTEYHMYTVFNNNVKVGTAYIAFKEEKGTYLSKIGVSTQLKNVVTMTQESFRETKNYKPIAYNKTTKIISAEQVLREKLSVTFKGKIAFIKSGKYKKKVNLKKKFVIGRRFFINHLVANKMKKGTEIKNYVYNPDIGGTKTTLVTEKILGKEKVKINDKEILLNHSVKNYGTIKNIHNYYDDKGLVYKLVVNMLNVKTELILEK